MAARHARTRRPSTARTAAPAPCSAAFVQCSTRISSPASPNSAAKRFSPLRVKLTTRLPGAASRAAHFSSVNRVITAAPSVPAR